ncbi:hypothetical protein ACFV2U_40035 [Streptomyces sp. NPDC059697]|uniref:hypothetical protein n=1 Tax=Streptomyces sp. NPDC059697 TaxID=3346912 RepID=UPI00369E13A9
MLTAIGTTTASQAAGAEKPIAWTDAKTTVAVLNYRYEVLASGAVVVHCTKTTADKDGYAVDRSDVVTMRWFVDGGSVR